MQTFSLVEHHGEEVTCLFLSPCISLSGQSAVRLACNHCKQCLPLLTSVMDSFLQLFACVDGMPQVQCVCVVRSAVDPRLSKPPRSNVFYRSSF